MAGKLFVLHQVADFAPGFFERTAVEDGCIQLAHHGTGYVTDGIYTSVPFSSEAFFSLIASWNADVPEGTTVEMQVRVVAYGSWSGWFSFGSWSPYLSHGSSTPTADNVARIEGSVLNIVEGCPPADMAQMRILLHSDDENKSPRVYLMAISTNATQQMGQEPAAFERQVEIPGYSCQVRDPAVAERIASATSLTMMLNRWGRDLLPEEVARFAYDTETHSYGNLSFLCAAAGMQGFHSYVAYTGIAPLRHEVWQGRAVAARVHYRAPALSGEEDAKDGRPLPPVLEGATNNSSGHLVVVRGFVKRDSAEHVLIHDPMAQSDDTVLTEIPLAVFAKIYTGLALFVEKGPLGSGRFRPQRTLARLAFKGNLLRLYTGSEELVPAKILDGTLAPATLCYTLSDSVAYATAAQRKFYYPIPDEHGALRFDRAAAQGRRMTFYLVGPQGLCWVAEKQVEAAEGSEAENAPAAVPPPAKTAEGKA